MICINLNSKIEKQLICGICEQQISDPRIVPCGESFCKECIDCRSDYENSIYKCVCGKKHILPEDDGFPVNKLLVLLLEKDAVKTLARQLSEESLNKLSGIKQQLNDLKFKFENNQEAIFSYCDDLRGNINSAIDSIITTIQNQQNELFETIKKKEEAYISELNEQPENKEDIGKSIGELEALVNEHEQKLSCFKMEDKEKSETISKIYCLLDQCKLELEKRLFKKERFIFQKDEKFHGSLTLGQFVSKQLEFKIELTDLRRLFFNSFTILQADFDFYSNGNLLFSHSSSNNKVDFCIIHRNSGRVIKRNSITFKSVYICSLKCFIHNSDKFAIVLVNFTNKASEINLLNSETLEVLTVYKHHEEIVDMHLNTDYVYFISKPNLIRVMPLDLEGEEPKFQESSIFTNLSPDSTGICLQTTDECIFEYKDDFSLTISNLREQNMVASRVVAGKLCSIFNRTIIITHDSSKKILFYYDLEGNYAGEQQIPENIDPTIIKCKNDMILFYEPRRFKLIYTKTN